ncbi:required for drug-induced death protein 1 [Gastrophryne carolinensis]
MAGKSRNKKKKYNQLEKEQFQLEVTPGQPEEGSSSKKKKKKGSSRKVHLSPLPDRYEPLEEGAAAEEGESKEDKKYKRKQKAKKYAKNVGKAFRTGCRYLLIGLQGLANAYASPFGVVISPTSH